jgi:endogenous inhibitor of DNA gyrase (YacG/DUF329 family)
MASSADRCQHCGGRLVWARTGRPARFCSTRCRVAAHRARPRQLVIVDQADDGSRCAGCGAGITRSTFRALCGSCLPDPFSAR